MANTGLLVLTNPVRIKNLLYAIKSHVFKTLYIQYLPEKNVLVCGNQENATQIANKNASSSPGTNLVANIYATASNVSARLDVRILLPIFKGAVPLVHTKKPIELVIFDRKYSDGEAQTFIQDCLANTSMGCGFLSLLEEKESDKGNETEGESNGYGSNYGKRYGNVVLGGTFDRLHGGHKILLSEAVLRCSKRLVVGVTDTSMLRGKILWELIDPCNKRMCELKDFLEDVDPSVVYEVVPIDDIYGPTKSDNNMDMLVVSEETIKGAKLVNELRVKNGLKELDVHVVKLAEDGCSLGEVEESKISSSNQRIRLLGTRLNASKVRRNMPLEPYIIGLTGGIASGKSSVAQKLRDLGAAVVNCDVIAHRLYDPGQPCYKIVIENFGKNVTTPEGAIDRKALGRIVFNDKDQLRRLNSLVWPIILQHAREEINEWHAKGYKIIVMEAAVMIQANWQSQCHEIWTCIIPEKEAIKRIVERNHVSEEEAKLRIVAQPSNSDQVNEANVVFSTLWSHQVTIEQVQKAWNELNAYLQEQKMPR